MAEIQIDKVTAKALREIAESDDVVVVLDGETPVARIIPRAVEIKSRGEYFKHYPHDVSECLATCWRHLDIAEPVEDEAVKA